MRIHAVRPAVGDFMRALYRKRFRKYGRGTQPGKANPDGFAQREVTSSVLL